MVSNFRVSVIMPVYNAAQYVRQAVLSAVHLPEVAEIILVEDKSPDNAIEVCRGIAAEFAKVKLFQHPNGENRGAGASRNLGIEKATCEYVAFLDADDLFLPNRFKKAAVVFSTNKDIDGVYGAAGFVRDNEIVPDSLYTIKKDVEPNRLFRTILRGTYGHFHTNSITLRKTAFEKSGHFNPSLRLGQDADLWLRIAYHCKLRAGEIEEPICLIRRHAANRILSSNPKSKIKGLKVAITYFKQQKISYGDYFVLVAKLYKIYFKNRMFGAAIIDLPILAKY